MIHQTRGREVSQALAEIWFDFPAWCSLVEIRLKEADAETGRGRIAFGYDVWNDEQKKFEAFRAGRDLVLKPRQIGFSTIELARDLWYAITHEGVNVLIVAHKPKIAQELFLTLKYMAEALKRRGLLPETRHDNVNELVFGGLGSAVRVVEAGSTESAADDKGRSGTIHRLHATEVAFWKQPHATMKALLSCVPAGGEVVIESTPNGAGGLFYDLVQAGAKGEGGYRLHFFPWYEHAEYRLEVPFNFDATPRDDWERRLRAAGCDDEQIAWWRAKVDDPAVGLEAALQEFPVDPESCFRTSGAEYIEAVYIDRLTDAKREPIRREPVVWKGHDGKAPGRELGTLEIWCEPVPGEEYSVGGDVAEGIGGDACAGCVMPRSAAVTVAMFVSKTISPGDFGLALAWIGLKYNRAWVGPERNNHGAATLRALEVEARYPKIYQHTDGRLGWYTSTESRAIMFDDLRRGIREGTVSTPDVATIAEARTLITNEKGKPIARGKGQAGGCHDDRFVAKAIALQIRNRPGFVPTSFRVRGI